MMKKKIVLYYIISCFILLFVTGSCIRENYEFTEGANIEEGDQLPSLSLTLSDGSRVNDQSLTGKVSVILLFTTECGDCRKQLPEIEKLYRQTKNNDKIVLFGISREQTATVLEKYWKDNELTFPYSVQEDRVVYELFATSIVPRTYISDTRRTVKRIFMEELVSSEELLAEVEELFN